jgi:ubiquinone/menaquinone biosynthesis C-methylase UbiE
VEALRTIPLDKKTWDILDVGCGAGFSMLRLLSYGLEPERLHGIDIAQDRIARGRRRQPALNFTLGDATAMEYPSNRFDLAMESTMFVQITDEHMANGPRGETRRLHHAHGLALELRP